MAQLQLVKTSDMQLAPATPEASEILRRIKPGIWVNCDLRRARNYHFHKRFFALLNLGFEYYTPVAGAVLDSEKSLLRAYVDYLISIAGTEDILNETLNVFLDKTGRHRAEGITLAKSFEAFRKWAVMTAGFYDEFHLPDGSVRREAKSISFAKMEEDEFQQVYKAVLNVLWHHILFRPFRTQQDAENAACQLMEFA